MTDEEIRIAIAETQGYEYGRYDGVQRWFNLRLGEGPDAIVGSTVDKLPDYLGSLDQMRNVLQDMDDEQWLDFMLYLCDECGMPEEASKWTIARTMLATSADQLARAYLRAKGLWRE
jgi:hypothetical protein